MTQKSSYRFWTSVAIASLFASLNGQSTLAQIVPDATLPIDSIVAPNGDTFAIDGGTTAGTNLFHSFSAFSVPTSAEAFFNNSLGIENIITRVTGNRISNIDGLLRANGVANFFLLNPNGIVFGPNARLDIGGSFFGSTAESLQFADGLTFGTTAGELRQAPLLSIDVPVGLQFGSDPGPIRVLGDFEDPFEVPTRVDSISEGNALLATVIFNLLDRPRNLGVAPDRTLAFVGGDITVEGAQLLAPGGRIALGGVGPESVVGIAPTGDLTYDRVGAFRDIHLDRSATVNVSGDRGGRLQLRGRSIHLTDKSAAIAQNVGARENASGGIDIQADILALQGQVFLSSLTLGDGAAGDAEIRVGTLALSDRAFLATASLGAGGAGRIAIQAADAISITDTSAITADSFALGAGGSIEIETRRLTLSNTGAISSSTLGPGPASNIRIRASEAIVLNAGPRPVVENEGGALFGNGLFSVTRGPGNAGNIFITTDRLQTSGGTISSATQADGPGGTIEIQAGSFEITRAPGQTGAARVSAGGNRTASGPAGSVTLRAEDVFVGNGAQLVVANSGSGDAGTLNVVANTLTLEDNGRINASTVSGVGTGGNINVEAGTLVLRRRGQISTNSGSANGGNITIGAGVMVALANSDITANAEAGFGGRVEIEATGIFGLEFRERRTPESDITATSALGPAFRGVVEIVEPEIEPGDAFVALPTTSIDISSEFDRVPCKNIRDNQFVFAGRGGVPQSPLDEIWDVVYDRDTWIALAENIGTTLHRENRSDRPKIKPTPREIVEATNWHISNNGNIELFANDRIERQPWHREDGCNAVLQE